MAKEEAKQNADYLNVLADGKFHQTVPEGTEGAVIRTYTTSDGVEGKKLEKVYSNVSGMLTKVDFYDGAFGKSLLLTIQDGEDDPMVISFNTTSQFGEDMLKKVMNIDMSKPVKIAPFALTDEKTGRTKKGVTVYQGEEKIKSYFHTYDAVNKKTEPTNGYPEVPKAKGKKPVSKDEWKMHFMEARLFMIDKVTEHFKIGETTSIEDDFGFTN